ncbi:MAG: UDP-N-acetylmuramoyl-tripeptide--D-alanyl-D-alanine ligase [Heliobacteriaceae bacterium]|jgi:UDP-N-acetylmuramoyl-tripeptide--D-alanyl-D-alanine ligase|nr:UDP-N-acetylmuramoyl-tripeptide--D-alanyl-D-alanine ligase [Heliobacteriaceae bacterium]
MKFTQEEILKTGAQLVRGGFSGEAAISTDTRTIRKGDLYLPLKGENFDGEKFIPQAVAKGAAGVFTTTEADAPAVFKVGNTLETYLKLANLVRNKFKPKVIAITGSSGKTTTKDMIAAVLSQKFKTHKTFSNHNNEVGLCQTILSMPEDTEVLILEMGMRALGEIETLSKYAEPDIAVITNIGTAHIGRLGSVENIAKAKLEIVSRLRPGGVLIAPDNEFTRKTNSSTLNPQPSTKIECRPDYSRFIYKEKEYELNVAGDYNIKNAIAAIETGYQLGMTYDEIRRGLLTYRPAEKRGEVIKVNGFTIINDSYNANPDSMKASVSAFIELYKNPVVVLGDMGELGEQEVELHREVGRVLNGAAKFITVGKLAAYIGAELLQRGFSVNSFDTNKEAARYILANCALGATILLKASRSMKFEEIIEELRGENRK